MKTRPFAQKQMYALVALPYSRRVAMFVSRQRLHYMGLPAMLRMVKVVVAYFKEYRIKYGRFMKRKVILGAWAVSAVGLSVRGWIFYGARSGHYSRYYLF